MNKRGQIYIIAALILSAVIFLLVSQTNFVQRILIEDDFEQLSKNFDMESARFMNSLLSGGVENLMEIKQKFEAFADKFSNYAWVENPNFEFIYVLNYRGEKIFGNYMLEDLDIGGTPIKGVGARDVGHAASGLGYAASVRQPVGSIENIKFISLLPADIEIRGMRYDLEAKEGPQIIIISREEKGEQTKVYLNKQFVKGEKVS